MNIDRPQKIKLFLAVILLLVTMVFVTLTRNLNHALSPAQPNEDTHSAHNSEGESQLVIEGSEQLREHFDRSVANSITTQLYAAHYEKSSKLEREAELVKLQEDNQGVTTIVVKFLPSGDEMTARITVHNTATNDFDISIEGVSNE